MRSEPIDTKLEMVSDSQRRELLLSLQDRSPQDTGVHSGSVSMADGGRKSQVEMHHRHLPKLEEAGLVTWNRDAGRVSRGPAFDDVRPLLALLEESENERSDQNPLL